MRGYFGLGQLSADEKNDILDQHKSLYNGYQTMQPKVSNTQPLTVYDFAGDKDGIVVNNKGEVKKYTNMGINEQVEQKEVCDECGSMMMEGECTECGWKGDMDEHWQDGDPQYTRISENECNECGGTMMEGECTECGWKGKAGDIDENTGHLDDIYNVNDLGDNDFDYVEGGGNDYGTFEKMHHMKKIKSESEYEDDDNEDDGFEDLEYDEELDEQGYTGGGNAPDMDISNIEPAYDFVSDGPGEVYPEGEMDEDECNECGKEYETMESAWADEELDETDISGSQGVYGDMDPAYDFDSEGPGKAGPYQHSEWSEETKEGFMYDDVDEDNPDDLEQYKDDWEGILWDDDVEYEDLDGGWEEIDDDLQESFITQKNKISEMMNRMNKFN